LLDQLVQHVRGQGVGEELGAIVVSVAAIVSAPSLFGRDSTTPAGDFVADPAATVNPLIGTTHNGNTFPGADAPFGMLQWSPDTATSPRGGGYSYDDTSITGFSLTHVSGPGCNAAGDIPVMPSTGAVIGTTASNFSHSNESAAAGSYAVRLNNGVRTELTATTRSGMARFTFPPTTQANLLFKLTGGQTTVLDPTFTVVSSSQVRGSVTSGRFCGRPGNYTTYFDMVFDRPFTSNGTFDGGNSVTFDTTGNTVVQAKVGLSYVSAAGATANREAENPGWDFAAVQQDAHNAWNAVLGKVRIAGGTAAQQTIFYTALYHSLLHPNVVSDTDGRYRGTDHQIHTVATGQSAQYGTFSGWDIYRSQAQLEALVAPQQASDTAQSMVNDYAQGGVLPKWALNDAETFVSAWYVWSALGMYPQTPGTADLALGSPVFTQATISLGGGGTISVNAPAAADNAPYVQSLTVDGTVWSNSYLPPSFALTGGTLDYTLGTTPNTTRATDPSAAPPSYPGSGTARPPAPPAAPLGPIASGLTGKCADVYHSGTANGTAVDLWSCNGSDAQKWTVTGDGTLKAFGKCLDVTKSGTANGTLVELWTCNNTSAQQWQFIAATGALMNSESGRCLDVPKSNTTNGTQLQIFNCNGSSAQRWTLPA